MDLSQSVNNVSNNDLDKESKATLDLADLFRTLDDLDQELGKIIDWLLEKEANIR